MKSVFVLLSLLFVYSARAENCHCNIHSLNDFSDLIQHVNTILPYEGAPDPRLDYVQYAERYRTPEGEKLTLDEVYDKFSANGHMYCPRPNGKWAHASANIVNKPNVSLTAAHEFFDKNCKPVTGGDFKSCVFQSIPKPPAQPELYKVKSITPGDKCPGQDKSKDKDDWAVVTLDGPVRNVRPFRTNRNCRVGRFWTGTGISASARDFRDGKTPMVTPSCAGKDYNPDGFQESSYFLSCSAAPRSSGGGLLCDRGRKTPEIGGIFIAGSLGEAGAPYSMDNYSVGIPITDEVETAINQAGN